MKRDIFKSAETLLKGNGWLDALFGIEKENIRVDSTGKLSQTPHPKVFGNKMKHPFITTDFSESQIEMITPPLPDIPQALGFLETIHDIVSLELTDEYLWPQSIPPILPDDKQIPIAKYDAEGQDAQQYREFLAKKYGPKNQLFSGIHFNVSFSDKLLELLYRKTNSSLTFDEFKDEAYLKATRQLLRLRWIYILLYGNSPVVDASMELQCKLSPYKIDKNVLALSIRNSCYGYQNLDDLYPDYRSVKDFQHSIARMVKERKITAPKELYSPIRPKFIQSPDHISYVELRFIDIDPLARAGITKEALCFLHALTLYGLLSEETDTMDEAAQAVANNFHRGVALYGLNTGSSLFHINGEQINIWHLAKSQVGKVIDLFRLLEITQKDYIQSLEEAMGLIESPRQRKVYTALEGIMQMGYVPWHMEKGRQYLLESQQKNYLFFGLEDMELSTQLILREAVKLGVSIDILDRKENFVRLRQNGLVQYVKQATKTSLDNYASILAMENKQVTKTILYEHGIRVPIGRIYTKTESALQDFPLVRGKAVVVKPNQTNFGTGITILKNNNDVSIFQRAIEIAFEYDSSILVEEFVEGKEFRFFVIGEEVAGILHRVPANVTGDGVQTISQLVKNKNEDPLRGKGYRTPLEKIQLGETEAMYLQSQGKDFDFISAPDEVVFLRENSNISTGGDSIDCTDDIPDSYKQIAVKAAKALNVNITGLDMIIVDSRTEATTTNYAIIELNFNPAIHIHCHPFQGKNRKINEKLMMALGFRVI